MAKLLDPNLYQDAGIGKTRYLDENDLPLEAEGGMPRAPVPMQRMPAESSFPSLASLSPQAAPQPEVNMQEMDLEAALSKARDVEGQNNLMKAANALLTGAAGYSGAKPDLSAANAAIDASTNLARSKAGDIVSKEDFSQKLTKGAMEKNKLKTEQADQDPNSDASKAFRKTVAGVAPWIVSTLGDSFEKLTAADKDKIYDPIKLKETIDARKEAARLAREGKKDELSKIELEEEKAKIKENNLVRKENRVVVKDLEKGQSAAEAALRDLKNVKKQFEDYSKANKGGTGPLSTLGGLTKYASQDTEKLDSAFKKVALGEMVKMFAGMSKAVDSNAERRAFESTQPSVALDDETNKQILESQIKAAESLVAKTKAARSQYNREGDYIEPEQSPEDRQEAPQEPQTKVRNGVTYQKVPGGWKAVK